MWLILVTRVEIQPVCKFLWRHLALLEDRNLVLVLDRVTICGANFDFEDSVSLFLNEIYVGNFVLCVE